MKEALDCRVQFQNLLATASYMCSEPSAHAKRHLKYQGKKVLPAMLVRNY